MLRLVVSLSLFAVIGCTELPPGEKAPTFVAGAPEARQQVVGLAQDHLVEKDVLFDVDEVRERHVLLDARGVAHVRLDQIHRGIPVLGGQVIVHVPADGGAVRVTDRLLHDLDVDPDPAIGEGEAIQIAVEHAERPDAEVDEVELAIVREAGVDHLAWHVALRDLDPADPALPVTYVDADTGLVVLAFDNLQTARNRITYDAQNTFPSTLSSPARTENQGPVPGNAPVNDCHDLTGVAWDYYDQFHSRDSFDDAGAAVLSVVELGPNYGNAFWDGQVLGYGDNGSGIGFSQVLDVVAHEFTHAVTQYTADLVYTQQSGGLNEATSDIMAAVVESWDDGWVVSNNGTWRVGEDLVPGGIRSMSNPAQLGAIGDFNQYNNSLGVHTSSGIANRAFVEWVSDPALTIQEAGEIWYTALTSYMTPRTTFAEARTATQQAALDLHGAGAELVAVLDGWDLVNVPGTPPFTLFDQVGPIALGAGQETTYSFTTSPNAQVVRFVLDGRNGDADLYVSRFGTPTTSSYDCRSITPDSYEVCEFDPATPGTYQVMVRAYASFSGARLFAWEALPGGLCPDNDGDGVTICAGDCDDSSAAVNPGATETCNGIDDDCDGTIDGSSAIGATAWYVDGDGDGYGDPATETVVCSAPQGTIATGGDCDDANPAVNPGADEVCNTIDDDCDGDVDVANVLDAGTWYFDGDGDGYGDPNQATVACVAPVGSIATAGDCDDIRASVNPGVPEVCNSRDDDCDGTIDGASAQDVRTFYPDGDGDGYGDTSQPTVTCQAPAGSVTLPGDCDDGRASVNPGAQEVCNGLDDDCDDLTDPPTTPGAPRWFRDGDGDGFGDPSQDQRACDQPAGFVADAGDCNDGAFAINPDAIETCNGVDDNCDTVTDPPSASGTTVWYLDSDSDGYGNPLASLSACSAPVGYVGVADDCNDSRADVSPAALEVCDVLDIDEDCDGDAEESGAQGELAYWLDVDGDGFGDPSTEDVACDWPAGAVAAGALPDCDDDDENAFPTAAEVCDGLDQDCDGDIDEDAVDFDVFYVDGDGDGFGLEPVEACEQPDGTVLVAGDCDDGDADVNPDATEIPDDGIDQDCDGADLRDGPVGDTGEVDEPDDPEEPEEPTELDGPSTDRNAEAGGAFGCSTSGGASFPAGALLIGGLVLLGRRRRTLHEGSFRSSG